MKIGIFGYPLSHSLAPRLFAKISELAGVQIETELFPTSDVNTLLETIEDKNLSAASISAPLKGEAIKHLDYVDADARRFDVADWIKREGSMLTGGLSVRRAISGFFEEQSENVENFDVATIAGYGVASAATMDVLGEFGIRRFLIISREPMRALASTQWLSDWGFNIEIWPEKIGEVTEELNGDVFINATPTGRWPKADELVIPPRAIKQFRYVLDFNYRPHPTRLVKEAQALSIPADTGLKIFLRKSLLQMDSWLGLDLQDKFDELLKFLVEEAAG